MVVGGVDWRKKGRWRGANRGFDKDTFVSERVRREIYGMGTSVTFASVVVFVLNDTIEGLFDGWPFVGLGVNDVNQYGKTTLRRLR